VSFDGIAKTVTVRVWNGTTATTYTTIFGNELNVEDAPFTVGNRGDLDATYDYDGLIDEVVVADANLTIAEIDSIRAGTYVYPPLIAGNIPLILTPTSTYNGPIVGNIPLHLAPLASYKGTGKAYSPVVTGGVKVGGDATIVFLSPYAPTVTGGVEVGGETEPVFTRPTEIIAEGGVVVGGYAGITFELPPVVTVVAEGGVLVGGEATVAFSLPTTFTWVAQGGVVVSGGTEPVTTAPTTYVHVVAGGVKVGGPFLSLVTFTDPPDLVVTPSTAAVALEVGGEAAVAFTRPEVVDVSSAGAVLVVGGVGTTTFIHPMILEVIAEGEITVGADVVYDEPFDTWTLNGSAYEPSVWTGWNFNSFAVHRGQAYGAGEDGIYLLEGSDDDGQKIHTGMRVGPVNFGSDKNKRLRSIHGAGWGSNVKVRVSSNGFSGIFRPDRDPGRVSISRDIIGSSFTIELSDFESLSQLEITPLVLARR